MAIKMVCVCVAVVKVGQTEASFRLQKELCKTFSGLNVANSVGCCSAVSDGKEVRVVLSYALQSLLITCYSNRVQGPMTEWLGSSDHRSPGRPN